MRSTQIGILGGGQLARMLIQAGINYPFHFHVFSKDLRFAARPFSDTHTVGDLHNSEQIVAFGRACDVLTVELEDVDVEALKTLRDTHGKEVHPSPESVEIIQDRDKQKAFLASLPTVPSLSSVTYQTDAELKDLNDLEYPLVNKRLRGGYDGYGTQILNSADDRPFEAPALLETYCEIERELATLVVRSKDGSLRVLPPVEMRFTEHHCLDYLICPPEHPLEAEMQRISTTIAEALDYVGVLAIEFFQQGSDLYVNELAPRPHNSAHYSQDLLSQSQFELHLRAVAGLPLPAEIKRLAAWGASVNLLGEHPPIDQLLTIEGAHVHIYDKHPARPGRKRGHVNLTADSLEELQARLGTVKALLKKYETTDDEQTAIQPRVGIVMGSQSDMPIMEAAAKELDALDIPYEIEIVSAHRTPVKMFAYGQEAKARGLEVIIAGAGGAAHLPGMLASLTELPVIGVPVKSRNSIDGWDSLLSIVQMPAGVPVATVGINNARNAALLAARMLASCKATAEPLLTP